MNDRNHPEGENRPAGEDERLALKPVAAARLLSISPRTLWDWTRKGIIPSIRIGTGRRPTVLYSRNQLERWLAERTRSVGDRT